MDLLQIFFISFAMAMDAMAVCIGLGATPHIRNARAKFRLAFHFGLFQFLMPILGYFLGSMFAGYIRAWDHWVAFALLAFLGGKMLYESFQKDEDGASPDGKDPTRGRSLILLSVATSLDAMAVGLTLAFLKVEIWTPAISIGIITASLSLLGIFIGQKLGDRFGKPMERIGGLILIGIGAKIVLEHLLGS